MSAPLDHRTAAESALAQARRNPVMSAEQWFDTARIHALLALNDRLADIAVALRVTQDHPRLAEAAVKATRENGKATVAHSEMGP